MTLLGRLTPSLEWFVIFYLLAAFAGSIIAVLLSTMTTKYLPADVLGRAEGILDVMTGIPRIVGPLAIPLLADAYGPEAVLIAMAASVVVSILFLCSQRRTLASPG